MSVNAWWSISGEELLAALRRVGAGDSPDVVYMELLANSRTEHHEDER